MLTLKIRSSKDQSLHTMQIDPQISVADLCQNIEQYLPKATDHDASEFGLFVRDPQQSNRSYWLDPTKTMNYYQLKNNDEVEYKNRYRQLKIRLLDGTVKTILIDDSLIVAQLMVYICTKFGIANYEEYSLVCDLDHGENHQNTKTLTLRRDRSLQRTDKKMEELRKKCHTDDDTLWLDQSKTLRQQDIDEQSTVVLRRKFFFSDTNIDQRDPVQLNLLYVQCRNGIIDGTHPVTLDEAVQFSGFQCQIEFGDFHESQHKSGVFDLKEFLPKEYLKVKHIDKRIVSEHKKHLGLCELDGKMKYTHLCRSLRTYGVTFFLVKEKLSGKHKLVPRLLGVTKESIVRVDERTKDFLQVWPLTHVKRWTASPNTFTLDFGDYATAYYSVQTNDGQQISQLIAGYIDIILKKRKDRDGSDRNGMTDDEATAIEDVIAPGKATIIQPNRATFGFVHQQAVQSPPLIRGTFSDVVHHSPHSTSESQDDSILILSIQNARTTNQSIRSLLNGNVPLSSLITQSSMHSELNRQLLSQNLAKLNASIAQIIISTSDISPRHSLDNHPALINGITTLSKTFDELVKEIHRFEANFLVERIHRFCSIFDDLLNSIENFLKNERDLTSKQNIPQLCSRLGEINEEILRQIDPKFDTTVDYREKLLVVGKSVANTTAVYVLKGKEIAGNINESTLINEIISRATQCALATSQLVACTKIVAPTISNPLCQEQLIESTRNVTRSIEFLLQTCCSSSNIDEHFQNDLTNAARTVRQNLNEFLLQIKVFTEENVENPVEEIFSASDRLFSSMGDANEMLKQTKILAQSTADLVSSLREKAESTHDDSNQQQKFLSAAKLLADATAKMVESAKICAAKPNDSQVQYQLKKSVEELRLATQMASNYQNCRKVFQRLEQNVKVCGTVATQFIAVTSATATKNRNQHGHQQLVQQCKIVADLIPKVVQAIRIFNVQTDSWPLQMHFLHICEDFLGPTRYLAELGQSAVPTIDDTVLAAQLDQSSRHLLEKLIDLRSSATKGQELCASVPVDIDTISQAIDLLDRELNELQQQIQNGTFKPLHNEILNSSNQFTSLCHQLKTHLCQLLDAFTRKDEKFVETSTRTIYSIVRDFVNATRQLVVKSHPEVSTQDALIQRSRQYVQRVISILHDGEKVLMNPSDGQRLKKLSDETQEFVTILNSSRETNFPQRHFDDAMKKMSEYVFSLAGPFERKSSLSSTHSEKLNRAADQLNQATNDLVKTTGQTAATQDLVKNSTRFSQAFGDFIQNSLDYVHQQDEEEKRSHLIIRLKNVHVISNQFLEQAKSASVEPMFLEKNHKQHLADAARAVTETIQEVISACLVTNSKSPSLTTSRFEFEQILRDLEASKTLLDESHRRPCANFTYFEALDNVVDNSKRLGEAMTHIASAAKNVNQQLFHQAVQDASRAVCQLVEASAQASYLITISNNYPGEETSALIDESIVNQSVLSIRKACANLSNSSIERNEILSLAAIIAKNTSILCNLSRDVSTQTTDSTIRRKFVQSAKDVANSTAELVRMIKIFDQSYTSEHHRQCIESSQPLLKSLDELYQCATSKELSNISTDQRQESILLATRQVVDGVCRIIECSKILIVNSKEASLWQQLATHTKTVSESIKRLATSVKDLAPGQHECEKSIERLRKLFQHVDQALTNPTTQRKTDKTLQFHQQNIKSTIQPLFELIDRLRQAAKRYSERLGTYVYQYLNSFESMISQTIDFVSFFTEFSKRTFVLEKSKSLVELSLQFLLSCKESGGNIKLLQWHRVLDQNVDQLVDSIEKFVQTIDETSRNPFDDKIRQFDQIVVPDLGNFGDYQTRMIEILREISRTLHEKTSFETIRSTLIVQYDELIHSTAGTIHSSMTKDLAQKIKQSVIELGANLNEFVDNFNEHHTDLDHFAQRVREKISQVLSLLQINLRGTQACHQATNTISNIISDLDTTIRSASANSLNLIRHGETFADHREAILKTAKALVEDTKTLVAAAAASQDQLAMAAQAAVRTMTKLSDVVKTGATPVDLHDGPIQVMLISSVKDVALALNNLINVTKAASGKPIDHPEMKQLKESAKIMVMNVTSLLRTVKTIEDKTQQGKNALEITIESIGHQLEFYPEENRSTNLQVTPEDLILVTKQITTATSKAVSAGQSAQQDEIIVAANLGRKATTDLLDICKSSLDRTHDRVLQQRLLENGRQCVKSYQDLLETIRQMIDQPTIEHKQKLVQHSRSIAQTIQSLVQCAEQWKSLTIDHDDPADVAEQELFHAAQSIESAAKKLSSLKPRRTVQEIDPDLNFDEQILDAAKSIMNAVSALITAATAAQKELVEQGKFSNNSNTNDDGQWSEGLISAARYVALSCQVLCDAANGLVQGNESEEKLISCATQVSSTTAALLVACKVKADFMSKSMTRLQTAGNAVKRAADTLVRAAQQAVEMHQEEKQIELSTRFVPGLAEEIQCKEAILTKERELNQARHRLKAIRLAKYGHQESESNESN